MLKSFCLAIQKFVNNREGETKQTKNEQYAILCCSTYKKIQFLQDTSMS